MIIDALDNRQHVILHTENTTISGYMLTPKIIKLLKNSTTAEEKSSIKMWRCITTAHNSPSAILGAMLNKIANAVKIPFMDHCEMKSKKYFQTTGIEMRLYYRTDAAQAVLCDWHDKYIYNMVKGDYSRMFETIPHSGVIEAVLWKFDLALKQTNSKYLCIDSYTGTHRWTRRKSNYGPTSKLYCIDRYIYEKLITTHLSAAVMMYDSVIYKQYHGVPQGAKSSKTDSEDYIDHKLYKFTKMLMQTHRHADIKQFRYLYFVADDLCAANCPSMPQLLNELSPTDAHGNHYLELKIENDSPYEITFCDVKITTDPSSGKIAWCMYDKATDFGSFNMQLNRYPHATSAILPMVHGGTFTGQCLRIYSLSQTEQMYMTTMAHTIIQLFNCQHKPQTIKQWIDRKLIYPEYPYQQWYPNTCTQKRLRRTLTRLSLIHAHTPLRGIHTSQTCMAVTCATQCTLTIPCTLHNTSP
jgi:hypothetical protein